MKKSIPFELFGPNQYIMFDIQRLAELERALGYSINTLIAKSEGGVDFCLKALPIGMKQHYRPDPAEYAKRIEGHLENGGKLTDIEVPIIKAIMATGIYGKLSDKMAETLDETFSEVDEKNVQGETE